MPSYKCPRCHYETTYISSYKDHLSRKNHCQAVHSEEEPSSILDKLIDSKKSLDSYNCEYCNKQFKTPQSKYQHKKKCNKKNEVDEINQLRNEIASMKSEMDKMKHQSHSITVNNNTFNIQNNVQNNTITLENFGKENVEFLADSFIRRCLFKAFDGVGDLTRKIHFNPEKPEYHNVTTTNKKDGFLEVFKNGKWIYDDKNKVLDALIKQSFDIISSHYDQFDDEIKAELSPTNFKRVDRFVESVLNQDKTIQNSLRKCLYLLILNNRHMVNKE
jgi:hypothetical protein